LEDESQSLKAVSRNKEAVSRNMEEISRHRFQQSVCIILLFWELNLYTLEVYNIQIDFSLPLRHLKLYTCR
jgi:hypothetical protein